MKKTLLIIMAVILTMCCVAACSKEEPQEDGPVTISTEEQPDEQPTEAAEEDTGAPADASPTTGLSGHPEYLPVIVQIENEYDARPQAGLQQADIVYESMIEATDTRFTCIYNDNYPELAGPLRSSRYYHQRIQQEWDGLYVHMGGAMDPEFPLTYIYGESGDHIKQRIDATKMDENEQVWRRSDKDFEHSAYVNVAELAKAYNYEPVQRQPFKFYPLEDYADEKGVAEIKMSFWRQPGFVGYTYDADKDKFVRYMNNLNLEPVPFITEETGEAIEVQNIIVQYVSVLEAPNEGGRKIVEMAGEGPAEFFIHGKHMKGTWVRPEYTDITVYYLENGEELTLAPGNTWIEVHPNDKTVLVDYDDGTTYDSYA
ncbi:MAG: DUF3048 domain-containing protein [Christensenellaceae bacterium]|jgi:hypothetical protein